MQTGIRTALRFSAVVSRDTDAVQAGRDLSQATRRALGEGPADLAFLFFSPHYAEQSTDLTAAVRRELAPNLLVGCTGEGIIGGTEEIESAPAISLWAARLPGVSMTPIRLSCSQDEDGISVSGWPDDLVSGPALPNFLLLGDPFSTGVDEALSLIAERCPGSMAIGGMAGGGRDVGENRMVLNDEVYEGGLVGVALSGPLSIRTVVSQGCRPIGERYVVTKAENNVIHELGGVPALERLQTVFETLSGGERRLAHRALHIGVVMNEQRNRFERGDFLVRNLIGADRNSGSVAIGDMIKVGQTVQFHIRDAQSASEDLHLMLAADRSRHQQPPLGALLFSCCGRGRGLFGQPHHDVTVLHERAGNIPVAGFFAQGEIGPVGGMNFLHGYTASVALFCE
ncbi:MAG: FIST N-terminal domain-containing protein, partial [Nitrospirota bacterium]|nr:FIST N-terminal domain-containing protein [Nitrospirota bacterium]